MSIEAIKVAWARMLRRYRMHVANVSSSLPTGSIFVIEGERSNPPYKS